MLLVSFWQMLPIGKSEIDRPDEERRRRKREKEKEAEAERERGSEGGVERKWMHKIAVAPTPRFGTLIG
jgi:hypothetical protein